MNPELFIVPSNVLGAIIQYLAAKPYQEVAELIAAIQQAEPYNVTEPDPAIVSEARDAELQTKSDES